jgi:hypothetical protein
MLNSGGLEQPEIASANTLAIRLIDKRRVLECSNDS